MKSLIKSIFQTKLLLKAIAILYAYFLWLLISQSFFTSKQINIPVILYDIPEQFDVDSPQSIDIIVKGRRFDMRNFIVQNPSLHIDAKSLVPGNQRHVISEEHILLPEEIKLIDYNPSVLNIKVNQKYLQG